MDGMNVNERDPMMRTKRLSSVIKKKVKKKNKRQKKWTKWKELQIFRLQTKISAHQIGGGGAY